VTAQIEAVPDDVTREGLQALLTAGAARNALDCALWDLEAKRAGKRIWDVLGLPMPRPEITAYTLSLDTPAKMEVQARANARACTPFDPSWGANGGATIASGR